MPGAKQQQGTQLERSTDGNTYVAVAHLKSIAFGGGGTDVLDASDHDSPDAFKEKVAGMIDPGQLSFEGNLFVSDTSQLQLVEDRRARTVLYWRLVLPALVPGASPLVAQGAWEFQGFVQTYEPQLPHDALGTFSGKIEITGPITFDDAILPS